MKFHQALADAVSEQGVTTIFGLIGDGNLYFVDSFVRDCGGSYVSVSHEAGAVLAASGYASRSGEVGVATVTHGPALTNTVTALWDAAKARIPVVLIAGDTAITDRDTFQDIPQRAVVEPTGAGFEPVRSPDSVAEDLAMAIRRAQIERRPIVLNVPIDFQWRDVQARASRPSQVWIDWSLTPSREALEAAVSVIASARRPIVLAGRGTQTSGDRDAAIALASRIQAPLMTTLRAKGMFAGEPADAGIFGTLSTEAGAGLIADADCIVALGASLNRYTSVGGAYLKGRKIVQVDADPSAIGRRAPVTAGVVGSISAAASGICELLDEAGVPASGYASSSVLDLLRDAQRQSIRTRSDERSTRRDQERERSLKVTDLKIAMELLEERFPRERTLVIDCGRYVQTGYPILSFPSPRHYVHTINAGSIGLGMGNAVGAAVAANGEPTLLVAGDGGFMLGGLGEFNTAARHGLDITVVIFNDGAYGAEHIQFYRKGLDPTISVIPWPDFGPVATALGGVGYTARTVADLESCLGEWEHRDRHVPTLIDVKVDPLAISEATP